MKWDQLAQKVPWVRLVVLAMLVLPVLLVILVFLDQLEPQAQQALRDLVQRLLAKFRLASG